MIADRRAMAPVQHLSGDHAGLDGFTNTNVDSGSRTWSIHRAPDERDLLIGPVCD